MALGAGDGCGQLRPVQRGRRPPAEHATGHIRLVGILVRESMVLAKQSGNRARFIGLLATGLSMLQLTVGPLLGQAPPAQTGPAEREPPALRVAASMVQVNVIVQDKRGNPVTDLARDDFIVYDQKKPQKIEYFSVEATRPLGASAPSALAPDTYSNRLELKTGVPTSVTVILLDTLNTHYEDV